MRLQWTEPAVDALQGIHDYIAKDQPFYAARFVDRLTVAAEKLREFPELGRIVPEAARTEIRELIFQGYRIIYRVKPGHIQILTVVHGSRDLRRYSPKPWEVS